MGMVVLTAVALAAGCGGLVVTVDDSEKSALDIPESASPGSGSVSGGVDSGSRGGSEKDSPSTSDVTVPVDKCPTFTPEVARVSNLGVPCRIAVDVIDNSGPWLLYKNGTTGSATLDGSTYHLTCVDGSTVLMDATIECFQGSGHYDLPAGALTLGGHVSDRKCRVDAMIWEGEIVGFAVCDTIPADPTNLFANTLPPIGLGQYALPIQ